MTKTQKENVLGNTNLVDVWYTKLCQSDYRGRDPAKVRAKLMELFKYFIEILLSDVEVVQVRYISFELVRMEYSRPEALQATLSFFLTEVRMLIDNNSNLEQMNRFFSLVNEIATAFHGKVVAELRDEYQEAYAERTRPENLIKELNLIEKRTLELLNDGKTHTQIGELLGVSPKTIQNRITQIRKKLGFKLYSDFIDWVQETQVLD